MLDVQVGDLQHRKRGTKENRVLVENVGASCRPNLNGNGRQTKHLLKGINKGSDQRRVMYQELYRCKFQP